MTARFDLHVHSERSPDAKGTLAQLAAAAADAGLAGFAITDHNATWTRKEIRRAQNDSDVIIIPGCEASTLEGHLLAFGIHEAPPKGAPVRDVIAAVHDQGGLVAPSHPLRTLSGLGPALMSDLAAEGVLRLAEARNGRDRKLVQDNTARMVRSVGLSPIGGTDAHWIEDIGTTWTEVPGEPADAGAVLDALRRGDCKPGGGNLPRARVLRHSMSVPSRYWRSKRDVE